MKKVLSVILAVIAVMSFMLIPVSAEGKQVSDIWVITLPDKMTYIKGEEIDLTGIELGVAYTDGSSEIVTEGIETDITVFNQKGSIPVTLNYKGEPEILTFTVEYSLWQKIVSIVTFLGSFFYITGKNIIAWF